jgi:hypothetical protein
MENGFSVESIKEIISLNLSNTNTSVISPFQMVKQPAALINSDESLIYTYPIVIDKYLQKEWGGLIRDFFTIQMLSQVKSSNILNITSSIASTAKIEAIDPNYRNPSDQLFNTLQGNNNSSQQNNNDISQFYSTMSSVNQRTLMTQNKSEIQYHLDSFRDFISNQIKNDPAYENLRPIATPIIIENFINVPLIIGTKEMKVDSQTIFWILFLALADNRELTSSSTLKLIKSYISRIPKEKFVELLHNDAGIDNKLLLKEFNSINPSRSINRIADLLESSIDKHFRQLEPIFNESRWLEEVGIGRTSGNADSLQISAAALDIQSFKSDVMQKFSNLFIGFISRDLLRILQSLVYVLAPPDSDGIDLTLKYQTLINDFIQLTKNSSGSITNNPILDGITASLYKIREEDEANTIKDADTDIASKIENFCESMSKISVKTNFDNIHRLRILISEIDYQKLIQFMDGLGTNVHELISVNQMIKNFVIDVSNGNVNSSDFDRIDDEIFKIIRNFFEDDSHGVDQVLFNLNSVPPIFSTITGIGEVNRAKNFFASVYSLLTQFASFCYNFSLMGHICEFFKELKVRIDVKKRNALSFPNYVLVIPKEYIVSLYNAMAYRRVAEMLKTDDATSSKYQEFKPSENDIGQMARVLNGRLGIPHIVIVDSQARTIYYKWNYLNRMFKLNESSIRTYIKNQRNLIQIF